MNRITLIVAGLAIFAIGALAGRQFGAGRYQIVFSPHVRADTFLLDTVTGRVWSHAQYTSYEGNPSAWDLEHRHDAEDEWTLKKKTE